MGAPDPPTFEERVEAALERIDQQLDAIDKKLDVLERLIEGVSIEVADKRAPGGRRPYSRRKG